MRRSPATLRCVALQGELGRAVTCAIYDRRPSPCRALVPAWEDGQPSPQCDKARVAHGMEPLTPATWQAYAAAGHGAVSP